MNLLSNAIYLVFANIIMALSQWGLLFVLVRTGGVQAVGDFSLVLAIVTPVFLFFQLGGRQAYVTDYHNKTPFAVYWQTRVQSGVLAVLCCLLAGAVLGANIALLAVWGLIKFMEALSDMENATNHKRKQVLPVARSSVLRSLGGMGGFAVVLALGGDVIAASFVTLVVYAAVWLLHDVRLRARLGIVAKPQWNRASLITTLGLARQLLPLGVMGGLTMLQVSLPRFVVSEELGTAALGEFSLMAYFISAASVIMVAVMQALLPNLAESFHGGKHTRFIMMGAALCGLLTVGGLLAWGITLLWGEELIGLLYGPSHAYLAAYWGLTIAACWLWLVSIVLSYAIQATRAFDRLTLPQVGYTVVTLLACLGLIPLYGLPGAFYALLASTLGRLLWECGLLWRIMRQPQAA